MKKRENLVAVRERERERESPNLNNVKTKQKNTPKIFKYTKPCRGRRRSTTQQHQNIHQNLHQTYKKITNQQLKSETGITLVALVITIIVLLILAGVTLVALVGEEGLINKARMSRIKTNEETAKEEIRVIILEVKTENEGQASFENIVKKLEEKPAVYIVRRQSRYASLTKSEDGKAITSIESLDGTEKAIYVTNTQYDVEIKITEDMKLAVTKEGEEDSKSGLEEKQEEIDRLNKDIQDLLAQIADLTGQLQNSNSSREELSKKITELQNQINQKNTEIANLNSQITNLQNQIKNARTPKVVQRYSCGYFWNILPKV